MFIYGCMRVCVRARARVCVFVSVCLCVCVCMCTMPLASSSLALPCSSYRRFVSWPRCWTGLAPLTRLSFFL